MEKAMIFAEEIPTGILYNVPAPAFADKHAVLKEGSLLNRPFDSEPIEHIIKNFI
jgi:hypothetical protein